MWLTMRVVLIDTWWNVNFIRKSSNYKNGNGFNRYMVECEFEYIDKDLTGELSFNRYMVECEYQQLRLSHKINNVLIDTWWNVNLNADFYPQVLLMSFNRYMVECE